MIVALCIFAGVIGGVVALALITGLAACVYVVARWMVRRVRRWLAWRSLSAHWARQRDELRARRPSRMPRRGR